MRNGFLIGEKSIELTLIAPGWIEMIKNEFNETHTSSWFPSSPERCFLRHVVKSSLFSPFRAPCQNNGIIHRKSNCDKGLAPFRGFFFSGFLPESIFFFRFSFSFSLVFSLAHSKHFPIFFLSFFFISFLFFLFTLFAIKLLALGSLSFYLKIYCGNLLGCVLQCSIYHSRRRCYFWFVFLFFEFLFSLFSISRCLVLPECACVWVNVFILKYFLGFFRYVCLGAVTRTTWQCYLAIF